MNLYQLLSILGALAWLPSIIKLISNWLTKARLSIISDRSVEIGYTANGPILNIRLAFSTEKKEALIKNITLNLKHENHDTHLFQWEWFEEELMHIETIDSGQIPYKKNQRAIAIKVIQDSLIEKKVGFHETEFKINYDKKIKNLRDVYHNLTSQHKELSELKITNEYNAFQDLIKNSFSWRVGLYTATVNAFTDNSKMTNAEIKIQFSLTSLDLKRLEQNITVTQEHTDNTFITFNQNYKPNWNWVYTDVH